MSSRESLCSHKELKDGTFQESGEGLGFVLGFFTFKINAFFPYLKIFQGIF